MLIKGLDNKEYNWKINTFHNVERKHSNLHNSAKKTIEELFPLIKILEEVPLIGTKVKGIIDLGGILYADFYIPVYQTIIEVHGEQHYNFNKHFYKNKTELIRAKLRDNRKESWCKLNNIKLIILNYNESTDEWIRKLQTIYS